LFGELKVAAFKKTVLMFYKPIPFEMTYSTDFSYKGVDAISMEGRSDENVAATNMPIGTDVNFGELTQHV
jgi:hypothetical protein